MSRGPLRRGALGAWGSRGRVGGLKGGGGQRVGVMFARESIGLRKDPTVAAFLALLAVAYVVVELLA